MARPLPYSLLSAGSGDGDAAVIKSKGGRVYTIAATNVNAAVRYLKLYDKATAPASTDTPVFRLAVPGATTGGGFTVSFPEGIDFQKGIGIRLVTGAADNDSTEVASAELMANVSYQ